jgi:hypothetical protein
MNNAPCRFIASLLSRTMGLGLLAASVSAATVAQAQTAANVPHHALQAAIASQPQEPGAGPVIYIADENGNLATVNVATHAVHVIGNTGLFLTDMAFAPKGDVLYAVTFEGLYTINTKTAAPTYIAAAENPELNALYIGANGVAYSAGPDTSGLYKLSLTTGAETLVGSSNGYTSAGDIVYYNGKLIMAAGSGQLVTLNLSTGGASAPITMPVEDIYGLAATGKNKLFGFAGTSFYALYPARKNVADRAKLLADLSTQGIALITGAAYDGYFGQ